VSLALVTGGTDGIGKEIARRLVREGHRVIVVGRDADKGAHAIEELGATIDGGKVHYLRADLSLVSDAHALAATIDARFGPLRYLALAAGFVRGRRVITSEGIESNFAVNFVGRFELTRRLLPTMIAAGTSGAAARIVFVSGAAHDPGIALDDAFVSPRFSTVRAVRQFCRANDLFVVELARRLTARTPPPHVTVSCLKVGVVRTAIRKEFPAWMKIVVPLVLDPILGMEPEEPARSALELLLDPTHEGETGTLYTHVARLRRLALDDDLVRGATAQRLWATTEARTSEIVTRG
jgi:NAD(P)-dependent dehydrogenase (short-subunit alcohol dehydrogenase family)